MLDTYLRKRAKDNLKGPPERDVIHYEPQQRVDTRFTDVHIEAQPVQQQSRPVPPPSGKGKVKKPKKGRNGEQEMGIV